MNITPLLQKLKPMVARRESALVHHLMGQAQARHPSSASFTLRTLVGIFVGVYATSAYANSGIGFLLLGQTLMVLALLPVIPIEAFVLSFVLGIPIGRALTLSFVANLASTFIGAVIALGVDALLMMSTGSAGPEPTKLSASLVLLPCIVLSWLIEYRSIAKRAKEFSSSQVRNATGLANLISSAGLIVFVWSSASGLSETGEMSPRVAVSEGLALASGVKAEIQEFYLEHRRLPDDARALKMGPPSTKYELTVHPGGRVQVKFNRPDLPDIHDKHVILAPTIESGYGFQMRWTCSSPNIENQRVLPADCRRPEKPQAGAMKKSP